MMTLIKKGAGQKKKRKKQKLTLLGCLEVSGMEIAGVDTLAIQVNFAGLYTLRSSLKIRYF